MTHNRSEVAIRVEVVNDMLAHARDEAPDECCGLLLGTRDVISRSFRARNARRSPRAYLIDPRDHFAAIKAAREAGAEVVGYYHSHPVSAPDPSDTDLAEVVPGDYYYVIVSPARFDLTQHRDRPTQRGRHSQRRRRLRFVPDRIAAFWAIEGNFLPVALVRVG